MVVSFKSVLPSSWVCCLMREMMMCHAHFGDCRWSSVFLLSTLNSAVASPTAPLDRDIDSEEPPPSSGHLNHKHLSCVATATSTISFAPGTSQSVFWIIWMVGNRRCTQLGYRRSCQCTGSVRSSTLSVAEMKWSPLCRWTAGTCLQEHSDVNQLVSWLDV